METAVLPRLAGGAGGCTGRNAPEPHHILSPRNKSQVWDSKQLSLKVLRPPFPAPTNHARSFQTWKKDPKEGIHEVDGSWGLVRLVSWKQGLK